MDTRRVDYLPYLILLLVAAFVGFMAWAVRGKSSQVFGPTIWHGPDDVRAIAVTFDDGPSESTPEVLQLLARYDAHATFFQCGASARRLPEITRAVREAGHEVGNHTERHPRLWLRSSGFIEQELEAAQRSLGAETRLFRPSFGVRWFGLAAAERKLELTRVMWSGIGCDWRLDAEATAKRLKDATRPGAILLLHDGREMQPAPDISSTVGALRIMLPWWREQGYHLVTVSQLCRISPIGPKSPGVSSSPSPKPST